MAQREIRRDVVIFRKWQFVDQRDVGQKLVAVLPDLDLATAVVMVLPHGGVTVAEEICKPHQLPLNLVFVRKIGVLSKPENAIGAIFDGANPKVVDNHDIARQVGLSDQKVNRMGYAVLSEIARRKALYFHGLRRPDLKGKTIVVADDGAVTGATLQASKLALKCCGVTRIIMALPKAPPTALASLRGLVYDTICLYQPTPFREVGNAYQSFRQNSDLDVTDALERRARFLSAQEGA